MIAPAERVACLRHDLVELIRQRDQVRAHGYATRKLDSVIASKQKTLELLERVADDLAGRRP